MKAYVPYSDYQVGAALLTISGQIVSGCNVENATFGATCCAERTAVFSAVAEGHRAFRAIAVATAGPEAGTPCGICRQVLAEFSADGALEVLCFTPDGAEARYTLAELLPHAFQLR
jgi:cytidine deaminase